MLLMSLLIAVASSGTHIDWALVAGYVVALVTVVAFVWTVGQSYFSRRQKKKKDAIDSVQEEVHLSGEYLRRSLDAFDELVSSLQSEVTRMTNERNEARKAAESMERKLTKEISDLRKEIRALKRVLSQNGIPVPAEIITED